MNNTIIKLILLIIVFLLLITYDKYHENFINVVGNTKLKYENPQSLGSFSVVTINDMDTERGYDLTKLGPLCIGKCVAEHGPNILFTNPEGDTDPLKWNKENPNKGFCYRANSKKYPFLCDKDCKDNKCGFDLNTPDDTDGIYDPNLDFSQCIYDEQMGCVEKKLNIITGQSCLNTVGCKMCIKKYLPNIENLKNVVEDEVIENEKCSS